MLKDFELTEENLIDSINKNLIGRNNKINNLLKLINIINKNTIISIDGKWGSGKTVFVKQIETLYNFSKNKRIDFSENSYLEEDVINKFVDNHLLYYYNAWENDNHIDPIQSLIYKIINDYPKEKDQTIDENLQIPINFKEFFKSITQNLVDIDKITSYKDLVNSIYTIEEQKDALSKLLNSIIPENKKLLIIIDELDRCNPKFAIKIIETIKHFYQNDNIIFILTCNNEQLSYSVSKFYGNNFDGYGYLNKIYDIVITLENIEPEIYYNRVICRVFNDTFLDTMVKTLCIYNNFSMREINKFLYNIELLYEYFNNYYILKERDLLKLVFAPYLLSLKITNIKIFNDFTNGKNIEDFLTFMSNNKIVEDIVEEIKNDEKDSMYKSFNNVDYVMKVYEEHFIKNDINMFYDQQNKKVLLDAISLIGNSSSF